MLAFQNQMPLKWAYTQLILIRGSCVTFETSLTRHYMWLVQRTVIYQFLISERIYYIELLFYIVKKKKEEKNACKILIIRYNLSLQVQNKIRQMYLYPDASLNSIDYFTRYRIQIENNNNCVPFLAGWRGLKEKSILQSIQTLWYCITFVTLLRNLIVRIIDQFSRIKIRVENLFFFFIYS